jgi:ribosomal-protein-alanine N-acetyltransferase
MFRITDAGEAQLEGIERLEKLCFSMPWTREQINSQLPDKEHIFLTAVGEDGAVAGYAGAMIAADEGYISNVAVDPEKRRAGIGGALVSELIARCRARQLAFVTLEVRKSNGPARALYAKYGFSDVGERKNYYDLPRENAILMTLFLK